MSLTFDVVKVGETVMLPGRVGRPDAYIIIRKYGNRVVVESTMRKGEKRVMMDNQFNGMEFEAWQGLPESPGRIGAESPGRIGEEDPELAELRRKYGD